MDSLLGTLTRQLDGDAVQQLSSQLGTDPVSTQKAVSAALPLLLGALGRNAAQPEGAAALTNALQRDHDGSVLNDVTGFLAAGGNTQAGNGILRHVLGEKQGIIEQTLSQNTGLTASSTGQLLAMLAPLVMGAVGQTQQQQGLNAGGLANLLGGEQQQADSMLGGLATQLLDQNNDGSIVDDVMQMGSNLLGGLFGRK
jgi:hypothetical protein